MKKVYLHVPEKYLVGFTDELKSYFTMHYFRYASDIVHHDADKISFYHQKYCANLTLTSEEIVNNEACFMKSV